MSQTGATHQSQLEDRLNTHMVNVWMKAEEGETGGYSALLSQGGVMQAGGGERNVT